MPFAPDVAIELVNPAPKARSALVATVTQPQGDDAVAEMSMRFPSAFTFNERFRPPRCQPDEEEARACPPGSRIGTIDAVSAIAPAAGDIFISDDFRLLIFAEALGGLVDFKIVGTITARPDNGFGVTFTGLPDLPLQSVELRLEAGDRALLKNPVRCGSYTLPSTFRAHGGAVADVRPRALVEGCPPPLRVRKARFAASGRLRWSVSAATSATEVVVTRGDDVVVRERVSDPELRLDVAPGRYRARLTPLAGGRRGPVARLAFRVP